jgi:protein-S-isoprenylcysteine O-methyltransferase Ste14
MGKHLVAPAEVRPDTELVTTGPFGLVRHPMYLSVLMLWAGGMLALLSWLWPSAWLSSCRPSAYGRGLRRSS